MVVNTTPQKAISYSPISNKSNVFTPQQYMPIGSNSNIQITDDHDISISPQNLINDSCWSKLLFICCIVLYDFTLLTLTLLLYAVDQLSHCEHWNILTE